MQTLTKITGGLCIWYAEQMERLEELELLDKCELLLCAADLALNNPTITKVLSSLIQNVQTVDQKERPLLHLILIFLVLTRFNMAEDDRRIFLNEWFNEERFIKQGVFIAGTLVNLVLQNKHILDSETIFKAKEWYLLHRNLNSDKLAAWAPFCLQAVDCQEEARTRGQEALKRRERNGSWGNDPRRTISCAYALALSKLIVKEDKTIDYILSRYSQGIITELPFKAQVLRLFYILGLVPARHLRVLQERLSKVLRVFLSYSRTDMKIADKIVTNLENRSFNVWIDRIGIALGEKWPERLAEQIKNSDVVLMLLTDNSLSSSYCFKEILYALKNSKPVLVIIKNINKKLPDKIDFILSDIQHIYWHDCEDFENLADIIENGLRHVTRYYL